MTVRVKAGFFTAAECNGRLEMSEEGKKKQKKKKKSMVEVKICSCAKLSGLKPNLLQRAGRKRGKRPKEEGALPAMKGATAPL